jgi:aspartokinase
MVTIAHLVEKIIEQKPFLQEALNRGIINNDALAEQLLPQIEKELKKKVKFSAVNMAIRRLSEKLKSSYIEKVAFDKNCDITVKSDLIEIIIFNVTDIEKYIKQIYGIVDYTNGDYLTVTLGLHEIMIIANKKYEKQVLKLFTQNKIKKIINDLSSLTIKVPINAYETVGLFYMCTRALTWENVSIVEIISTLTEMTFIVKDENTAQSFETLKKVIKSSSVAI